jgi:hypothetical protein
MLKIWWPISLHIFMECNCRQGFALMFGFIGPFGYSVTTFYIPLFYTHMHARTHACTRIFTRHCLVQPFLNFFSAFIDTVMAKHYFRIMLKVIDGLQPWYSFWPQKPVHWTLLFFGLTEPYHMHVQCGCGWTSGSFLLHNICATVFKFFQSIHRNSTAAKRCFYFMLKVCDGLQPWYSFWPQNPDRWSLFFFGINRKWSSRD